MENMEKIIGKAAVLIEALPYIKRLQGKRIVVKYGGSVIAKEKYCESVLRDVVFMRTVGMHPILIHGGGKAISDRMKKEGINPKFHHGMRVTDESTMSIVEEVLVDTVGSNVVKMLSSFSVKALHLTRDKIIKTRKMTEYLGEEVDLGYVGEIEEIRSDILIKKCTEGIIPIIAPIGFGSDGKPYNINADILAGEIASSVRAEKLVLLSDVLGIMRDLTDESSLFSTLKEDDIQSFIEKGIIKEGMIPKVHSCIKALDNGASKAHIIDGRILHSLLLEIFTDQGVGTEIVK
ncbi:MAG: acetylglutamate kinase [Candidatus Aureabacteria bacterium]|nr:acetylglutamate kinase [Candidatus Auribacterota bacterium]